MTFRADAKKYKDAEEMAAAYLSERFGNQPIQYPINPFVLLQEEGVLYKLSDFNNLEGVYIPAATAEDTPIVGININRRITRQRYTAAHELCHHFRDADKNISCPFNGKNHTERFAENFAAALLMPMNELVVQVNLRKDAQGYVNFDDVLDIAEYFGVSFQSCLFRLAFKLRVIEGNTEPNELKRKIREYKPDSVRKERHLTHIKLYAQLVDCYSAQLAFIPSDYARYRFQNEYIYNDSRMEGLNVTIEQASEIVTDLRLNMQNSPYCHEKNEAFLSIAGHYQMYQDIFNNHKDHLSVFDMAALNRTLFSCYPHPEFGGTTRQNNTLVIGAKFETADYRDIFKELLSAEQDMKTYFAKRENMSVSEYIKCVVRTHHHITVIHPFPDGNGRTARAFLNAQLVQANLPPIYIKADEKPSYSEALARADKTGDYEELYEIIFKALLRSHVGLSI